MTRIKLFKPMIKWVPRDLWIGMYITRGTMSGLMMHAWHDIYICLIPTVVFAFRVFHDSPLSPLWGPLARDIVEKRGLPEPRW